MKHWIYMRDFWVVCMLSGDLPQFLRGRQSDVVVFKSTATGNSNWMMHLCFQLQWNSLDLFISYLYLFIIVIAFKCHINFWDWLTRSWDIRILLRIYKSKTWFSQIFHWVFFKIQPWLKRTLRTMHTPNFVFLLPRQRFWMFSDMFITDQVPEEVFSDHLIIQEHTKPL